MSTPSTLDGMDSKLEKALTEKSCEFIIFYTQKLKLSNDRIVIATACVYFHTFFSLQSMKQHDRYIIALVCVFLACKVEEQARHIKDIVTTYYDFRYNQTSNINKDDFHQMMDTIICAERILLQTLSFNLEIVHPYSSLTSKLRQIKSYIPRDRFKEINDTCKTFINDSFCTKLCLIYTPDIIAASCILMGVLYLNVDMMAPTKVKAEEFDDWQDLITSELEVDWKTAWNIAHTILDTYDDGFGRIDYNYTTPSTIADTTTTTTTTTTHANSYY